MNIFLSVFSNFWIWKTVAVMKLHDFCQRISWKIAKGTVWAKFYVSTGCGRCNIYTKVFRKYLTSHRHTCQPSRSRRDSPDLETETRRPARRPKKADSSRFVPINAQNTVLNPLFACSLCSSVGIQVSSVSFGHFSCTRPWQAVIQTKKSV